MDYGHKEIKGAPRAASGAASSNAQPAAATTTTTTTSTSATTSTPLSVKKRGLKMRKSDESVKGTARCLLSDFGAMEMAEPQREQLPEPADQPPAWWQGVWNNLDSKLDGTHGRMEHLVQLQSSRMDSIEARLEMEARRSKDAMKDMHGAQHQHRLGQAQGHATHGSRLARDGHAHQEHRQGKTEPDNAALKDITDRLNRLETGEKNNNSGKN